MRVVITGATGRVGRAIYVQLARDHDVLGLDRAPSSTADRLGDITDEPWLEDAVAGADAVVHVAALHAPQVGHVGDAEFERVNVGGTRAVLAAASRRGVPHIVYTSTTALYGTGGWITEQMRPQPRTVYHRTKLAAERLLEEAAGAGGPAVTVLRMSRCFPEPAPVMAAFRLHRGVDARDVAGAHVLALAQPRPGYRVYVISGATPFRPDDMPKLLRDAPTVLRRRAPALVSAFDQRGWSLPESIDRVYSPALAQAELGWQPRHGFDEVLRQLDALSPEILPPRRG
ncbi:MAG: NAD(P)-dependent oxidoreductase [Thermoanaerobaculaceae bacterium]|jgi:nucleoside-diphosphate-sugar epimerase|nr:NAD(P)-dependent oxidoreductase [Thermoanaerobaculaceae bacterium]